MISQVFSPIVERILIKLQMVLNHSWGWMISGMIFLLNFYLAREIRFRRYGRGYYGRLAIRDVLGKEAR